VLAGEPSAPLVVLVSSRERLHYGHLVDASTARGFIAKAGLSGETLLQVVVDLPDAGQELRPTGWPL
jgi:hypothetical protein